VETNSGGVSQGEEQSRDRIGTLLKVRRYATVKQMERERGRENKNREQEEKERKAENRMSKIHLFIPSSWSYLPYLISLLLHLVVRDSILPFRIQPSNSAIKIIEFAGFNLLVLHLEL
jgi:hypothetical protein